MGELNVHTTNIDESLSQHIESTQNWQRYTGERIRNLEQQQQQSQEEWRAYYRSLTIPLVPQEESPQA